ncbi:hypothetical protein BJ742DRAFT_110215 [Cladochytrium replicatum]|nr:hypothetical protein BJ742DRAFT_110215 [Cladochytrium replicatum]
MSLTSIAETAATDSPSIASPIDFISNTGATTTYLTNSWPHSATTVAISVSTDLPSTTADSPRSILSNKGMQVALVAMGIAALILLFMTVYLCFMKANTEQNPPSSKKSVIREELDVRTTAGTSVSPTSQRTLNASDSATLTPSNNSVNSSPSLLLSQRGYGYLKGSRHVRPSSSLRYEIVSASNGTNQQQTNQSNSTGPVTSRHGSKKLSERRQKSLPPIPLLTITPNTPPHHSIQSYETPTSVSTSDDWPLSGGRSSADVDQIVKMWVYDDEDSEMGAMRTSLNNINDSVRNVSRQGILTHVVPETETGLGAIELERWDVEALTDDIMSLDETGRGGGGMFQMFRTKIEQAKAKRVSSHVSSRFFASFGRDARRSDIWVANESQEREYRRTISRKQRSEAGNEA